MTKERVQRLVVGLVVILLVASALGYLLVPSAMLRIVGIQSNPQVTFLVRTIAAALLALSPGAWAARRRDGTAGQRSVLIGWRPTCSPVRWLTCMGSSTTSWALRRCQASPFGCSWAR
jgi:hypothetical protein